MSQAKRESLPKNTNLTVAHLFKLLANSPELIPVKESSNTSISYFIRKTDTDDAAIHMMVLPPSTDKVSDSKFSSLETVVQEIRKSHTINETDVLVCPLLQEHHYGLDWGGILKPIKLIRGQWVTLVVSFDKQIEKWVSHLIDPAGEAHAMTYGGMKPFAAHLSKAFSGLRLDSTIARTNLNVQDPYMRDPSEKNTSSSGHWVMCCIQLLLKGVGPKDLAASMRNQSIETVIGNNQKLYKTPCRRPSHIAFDTPKIIPVDNAYFHGDSEVTSSGFTTPNRTNGLGKIDTPASVFSRVTNLVLFDDDNRSEYDEEVRESQFDVCVSQDGDSNANMLSTPKKTTSASTCLNCYALLFLGGTTVAVVGILCLCLTPAAVLPVVSTGLIVAGALGIFAGTAGMCAKPSSCCPSTTPALS